jgi:hypothetical protein
MRIALLTAAVLALAVPPVLAQQQPDNSAKQYAPGQRQKEPGDAKKFAPGQKQKEPGQAKKYAPGQQQNTTTGSGSRSGTSGR